MPEVMFSGPPAASRRFHPSPVRGAPLAIILHPPSAIRRDDEQSNRLQSLLHFRRARIFRAAFQFSRRRRSQGGFDHGQGELSDAQPPSTGRRLSIPKRAPAGSPESRLAPDRHAALNAAAEIEGFVAIAPPATAFDFSFSRPVLSSGLFVHGDQDRVAPLKEVTALSRSSRPRRA